MSASDLTSVQAAAPQGRRQILVTSALPYANGQIHIGHLVEYIQTDIWVRTLRMHGHEVYYIGADDTHGTPVMLRAEKEGLTPKPLIERVWAEHQRDFDRSRKCSCRTATSRANARSAARKISTATAAKCAARPTCRPSC